MAPTGTPHTRLITIRGNSVSGKSTLAARLRAAHGRGLAVIGQDLVRRDVLKERDRPGGANIGLIDTIARYALDHGYHVVVEGILYADHYGPMLTTLVADHQGTSCCFYLDVPFDITLERHATKPQADAYGEAEMRQWWHPLDLLPDEREEIIDQHSTIDQSVSRILRTSGLDLSAPRTRRA
ncbi:kinase [Nocardiopsis sp. CNR-923]|uniref:AAA family ATPase n=1 Tax=Nocardiopsis sp. CNR-923 TaxID=1904965 RepID=UPI0009625BC9|nr:AAA family ATPase [Nocardiopsis sp. CNR-923]OLT24933.1 kinase [Nocardiopsis sp. CNR-923]